MDVLSGHIPGVGEFAIRRLDPGSLTVSRGTPIGGHTFPVQAFLVILP